MIGIVQRGAHQIVHRGVYDGKILFLARLQIFHTREQHAGIADQHTPGFEDQLLRTSLQCAQQGRDVIGNCWRRLVLVADPQAAAQVEMLQHDSCTS